MKQKLLISYSRHQTPFVDRLVGKLEKLGYQIWLDYRSLVPAKPWEQQIETGITEADAVIFLVSKDSIKSQNVVTEREHALEHKKRIILLIFEACPLPAELQGCEWVDFRVHYEKSLKQLQNILDNPPTAVTPPPQRGFKAPKRFWLALILSVVALVGSIPTWWTILIPYVLVPLPWKIYKRNYNFSYIVPAFIFMPIFLGFTAIFFFQEGNILYDLRGLASAWGIPAVLADLILLWILLTPTMQRRAGPEAARIRFANPLAVNIKEPHSVVFAIDHAPEDGRYAEDLLHGLERYGHRLAGVGEIPEAVFVLISTYKKSTEYDPDRVAVYPVLLQTINDMAPNLQRIQWIDFRNGVRHIDKLAKLLPEPARLLKALAVAPMGSQEVFPNAVSVLQYFYLLMGIMGMGGLLIDMLSLGKLIALGHIGSEQIKTILGAIMNGILLAGAVFHSVRGLRSRRGGTAAVYPLLILALFQAVIYTIDSSLMQFPGSTDINLSQLVYSASAGTNVTCLIFPIGLLAALLIIPFQWKELYRWLPRRQENDPVNRLESVFLLYTPLRKRALIFHMLFHATLLSLYLFFFIVNLTSSSISLGSSACVASFAVITALGFWWLARRISK